MKPSTLLHLAFAGGRADTARVLLTAVSSALGVLTLMAAATVAAIEEVGPGLGGSDDWNDQYSNALLREPGLRPGVVLALLLLAIPVLALAGQCIRFGSPARDRRLAALRLAGATPRQTVQTAAAETLLAAGAGALLGLAVFFAGRPVLDRPNAAEQLPLPTDVLPPVAVTAGIVLAVPLLAALVGAFLLRKVIITPFGVVRRTRERRPGIWPGLLILGGVFAPLLVRPLGRWLARIGEDWGPTAAGAVAIALIVLAVVGVIVGTGWITRTAGRLLHRFGRRPAMLVAGRNLMADPWSGSRTFAALLAAAIIGGGALALRASWATQEAANVAYTRLTQPGIDNQDFGDDFLSRSFALVNLAVVVAVALAAAGIMVALAEGIVSRRRGYAALVATGVPRRTLGEAIAWQTLAPLLPAVTVALTVGVGLVRSADTTTVSSYSDSTMVCTGTAAQCADAASPYWVIQPGLPPVTLSVPVPLGDLMLFSGGVFAIMVAVVGVGLLFLRMSTDLEELRVA